MKISCRVFKILGLVMLLANVGYAQETTVIDHKGTLHRVTSNTVTTNATAPTTPVDGDVWFDTTTNTAKIYEEASTTWKLITSDHVTEAATAPANNFEGDIWFDTTENITKIWDGTAWQNIQAASATTALWDTDTDTGIQVEGGTDDDTIRFDTAGTERLLINPNGVLLFANPGAFLVGPLSSSAVLGIDGTDHSRLRLTAGSMDTQSDDQGASIDLHGNTATSNTGRLDLVAGSAASGTNDAITFWTNNGTLQQSRAVMTGMGNFGIGAGITPTQTLDVDGTTRLRGALRDSNDEPGTAGQVLSSNATGTDWIDISSSSIADADNDTKIQVEETADDDTIRFDVGGTEMATLDSSSLTVNGGAQLTLTEDKETPSIVVIDDDGNLRTGDRYWYEGQIARTTVYTNLLNSNMTATQASTYQNNTATYGANIAINGFTTNTQRILTNAQDHPWWKLDMGSNITLNRIKLYQFSSSSAQDRLSNFYVVFSQSDISLPATPSTADFNALINNTSYTVVRYRGQIPDPNGDVFFDEVTARYLVIIRASAGHLQMAAIEAYKDTLAAEAFGIGTEQVRVGINTIRPSQTLDVDGTARIREALHDSNDDPGTTGQILSSTATGIDWIDRSQYWVESDDIRTLSTTNIFTSTMTATQGSTYTSNVASNAIDGNLNQGTRALTNAQPYPWWKIDMGSNQTINRLKLYQYLNSQERFSNFYVVFSQTDITFPNSPSTADFNALINNANYTIHEYSGQVPNPSGEILFTSSITARYMMVVRNSIPGTFLQMTEVEAYNDLISSGVGITTEEIRVGIGTTNPTHTLHVIGTAGLSTGTAWTNTSDLRLKENITPYTRGLREILKINPIYYSYTEASGLQNDPTYGQNIGISAQELKTIIPEAISTKAHTMKNGTLMTDALELTKADAMWFALINAVKELNTKNEILKVENKAIKSENKALQESIHTILKRLEALEQK